MNKKGCGKTCHGQIQAEKQHEETFRVLGVPANI